MCQKYKLEHFWNEFTNPLNAELPVNSIIDASGFKSNEDFSSLMVGAGYSVRVFNPAGQDDIGGGCGQLWYVQDWMKNNSDKIKKSRGFGLPKVHTPKVIKN